MLKLYPLNMCFRPGSFTSVPAKVMEQIFLETILWHMGNKVVIWDSQQGCPKDKSYTNLVAFHNSLTALVHEARATHVIYLDLCKASDTVRLNILVSKFERHRFEGWTTWWKCLDDHTWRAVINTMAHFNLLLTLKIHEYLENFVKLCSLHENIANAAPWYTHLQVFLQQFFEVSIWQTLRQEFKSL